MKRNLLLCAAAIAAMGSASHGSIVIDNGDPDFGVNPVFSSSSFAVADDFVLAVGSNSFNQVTWTGAYVPSVPGSDDLAMVIYEDDSGVPDPANVVQFLALDSVTRTDTGMTTPSGSFPFFEFDAMFDTVTLNAGQTYWISLVNLSGPTHYWARSETQTGNFAAFRNAASGEWSPGDPGDMSFRLSIPAPGSAALLGVAGVLGVRRRR